MSDSASWPQVELLSQAGVACISLAFPLQASGIIRDGHVTCPSTLAGTYFPTPTEGHIRSHFPFLSGCL